MRISRRQGQRCKATVQVRGLLLWGFGLHQTSFSPHTSKVFCTEETVNRANLSFYTHFFFLSPLHTCCWLELKMPPLSIFSFAEEPLMEPCLTLQRGVFNQCNCPTFSICVCVCLPSEPEGGLLIATAMMVMMVVMMMRWQWHCSRGFWFSSPCLLKDSLR